MRIHARRVLVVDDCPDTAESCAELLALSGHEARSALSAAAALEAVAGWAPDVALVDLAMPGASGYELARRLRSTGAPLPVLVAVTGFSTSAHRRRAAEARFDHFLVKPMDPDALAELLDSCPVLVLPRHADSGR